MTAETAPEAGMRLAPCPFCGGAGRLTFGTYELDAGYHAVCEGRKDCPMFCSTPYRVHETRDEAIEAWNTRSSAPVPPAGGEGEAQLRFMSANLRDIEGTEDFLIHYHERVLVADNIDAALAARAQPPVGEVVNLAAMREYAVAMTKKHGNPIGTDYEQGQNDMGYRWVHSFDDLPAAHPASRDGGDRTSQAWADRCVARRVSENLRAKAAKITRHDKPQMAAELIEDAEALERLAARDGECERRNGFCQKCGYKRCMALAALAALPTREERLGGQTHKYIRLEAVMEAFDAIEQ